MSRLDSVIRRLEAQRAVLDRAAREIAGRPGLVLELGLGNGRTYDHLRERLPDREIHVCERDPRPNPRSMPPPAMLIRGEMEQTLAGFAACRGRCAVLIHADVTTGVPERDLAEFRWLAPSICALALPEAVVLSGFPLEDARLVAEALPGEVPQGRYFVYRRIG
jgi:hypothetical protein